MPHATRFAVTARRFFLGRLGMLTLTLPAVLAGCATPPAPPPPPKPTLVAARISASSSINGDASHRPKPLQVRVYELSARDAFEKADFVSLLDREKEALGADLVAREEWILQPAENKDWSKALAAETRFIGVVGAYRDIERSSWRALVPIRPNASNNIVIRAEALAILALPSP